MILKEKSQYVKVLSNHLTPLEQRYNEINQRLEIALQKTMKKSFQNWYQKYKKYLYVEPLMYGTMILIIIISIILVKIFRN